MTTGTPESVEWIADDELETDADSAVTDFDILVSPNDWNVLTISSFLDAGAIKLPFFQRNYVWDIRKASRLIESMIVGLPVPQVFLYEQARNEYLIIDGQQRLLSLFFFLKGRFPRPSKRGRLREILHSDRLDQASLDDNDIFQDFKLSLVTPEATIENRFHGLKYSQLDEYKTALDLRTLRNVVIKQIAPHGDDAMYEIFNRLNTGGVNLAPQEIRASLYRSHLMRALDELNMDKDWRALLGRPEPDARMKDAEILVRAVALAVDGNEYVSPMTTFVNRFCARSVTLSLDQSESIANELKRLVVLSLSAGPDAFRRGGKFSPLLFEAIVATLWNQESQPLTSDAIRSVAGDREFIKSLQEGSTKTTNVEARLRAARRHLAG